ncbi:hypothetical protein GQ457_09G013060 [Hibiscus cannabinus]
MFEVPAPSLLRWDFRQRKAAKRKPSTSSFPLSDWCSEIAVQTSRNGFEPFDFTSSDLLRQPLDGLESKICHPSPQMQAIHLWDSSSGALFVGDQHC